MALRAQRSLSQSWKNFSELRVEARALLAQSTFWRRSHGAFFRTLLKPFQKSNSLPDTLDLIQCLFQPFSSPGRLAWHVVGLRVRKPRSLGKEGWLPGRQQVPPTLQDVGVCKGSSCLHQAVAATPRPQATGKVGGAKRCGRCLNVLTGSHLARCKTWVE